MGSTPPRSAGSIALIVLFLWIWYARESHNRLQQERAAVVLTLAQSQQAVREGDLTRALAEIGEGLRRQTGSRALAEKAAHLIRHASLWISDGTLDFKEAPEIVLPETLGSEASSFWFGADRQLRVASGPRPSIPAHCGDLFQPHRSIGLRARGE